MLSCTHIPLNRYTQTRILTCVTCGSGVSRPITGASETVPGLTASASMFTVVWHTSKKKDTDHNYTLMHVSPM